MFEDNEEIIRKLTFEKIKSILGHEYFKKFEKKAYLIKTKLYLQ